MRRIYDVVGTLLTVTVPKKLARLSEISVKAENGDITVAPSPSLSADKLTVSSDNGDIVMRNILGASLVASSDNGDITAERINFETSDLSSENGDLIISPSDGCSAYRYHLSGGNGDIRIGDGIYQGSLDSGNGLIAKASGELFKTEELYNDVMAVISK